MTGSGPDIDALLSPVGVNMMGNGVVQVRQRQTVRTV